jgi:hypothetical protein
VASCYDDDVITAVHNLGGTWVVLMVDLDADGGLEEVEDFRAQLAA